MINKMLKITRLESGMKQFELAEKLGISNSLLSKIEDGNSQVSLKVLQKYSSTFSTPIDFYLFFSEEIDKSKKSDKFRLKLAKGIVTKLNEAYK